MWMILDECGDDHKYSISQKAFSNKEPEERNFFLLGTHKTEANSNPFANTISPD